MGIGEFLALDQKYNKKYYLIYLIAMHQVWFGIWQQKTFSFKLVRDRESNLTNKRATGAPCIYVFETSQLGMKLRLITHIAAAILPREHTCDAFLSKKTSSRRLTREQTHISCQRSEIFIGPDGSRAAQ